MAQTHEFLPLADSTARQQQQLWSKKRKVFHFFIFPSPMDDRRPRLQTSSVTGLMAHSPDPNLYTYTYLYHTLWLFLFLFLSASLLLSFSFRISNRPSTLVYKASAVTPSIIEQTSNGYSHQLQQLQSNTKSTLKKSNCTERKWQPSSP